MGHHLRQFGAILRDSYREAVDSWIILIMLALGAVVITLCASMGFQPLPAEEAFPKIVQSFTHFLPHRGQGRDKEFADCTFLTRDIQKVEEGFRLIVEVQAKPSAPLPGEEGRPDIPPPKGPANPPGTNGDGDTFREAVARWLQKETEQKSPSDSPPQRFLLQHRPQVSTQEQQAVQPADMEEFLAQQFQFHAAMPAQVRFREKRTTPPNDQLTYLFDVTVRGGVSVRGWPHTMTMFFGGITLTRGTNLGIILYFIEDQIINGLGGGIALLLSVIVTAFFIPNLLRKGSVDLLISKPIGRMTLLAYKYIGGLIFVLIITTFTVGGVWLALALRSGYWNLAFLAVIPLLTFAFAILYAVSTLVATLTRSAFAAIIVTLLFMFFLYIVGQVKTTFDTFKKSNMSHDIPAWATTTVDTLNNVLPRYKDLDKLTTKILSEGTLTTIESVTFGLHVIEYPSWWNTLGVSLLYIVVLVGLAGLWFRSRDY
jgi:ABC-type transport system involved in multi-copper enzyme maturation permease subunit